MNTQVILTLPDDLYEQAQRWADLTQQDVSEALTEVLSLALTPMYTTSQLETPLPELSDADVLALSRLQIEPEQGQRLSELLFKQREGDLLEDERPELLALMQLYGQLWIRQSEALVEAVKRGLRPPLAP